MDSTATKNLSFLSWNVQGLGEEDKCVVVRDLISSAGPDFACLQESKLASLDMFKTRSFLPTRLTSVCSRYADGSCGGIITTWDQNAFSLVSSDTRSFTLTTLFTSTASKAAFHLTNVYAPADHSFTYEFLAELAVLATSIPGPWVILGDFNLIRYPPEKNNDRFDRRLENAFNDTIRSLGLIELPLSDRRFTWTNRRDPPTLARLDRVFVNTSWDAAFPNSSLVSLPRPTSEF